MVSSKIRVHFGVTMLRIVVTLNELRKKCIVAFFFLVFYLKNMILLGEMLIADKLDNGA